MTLVFIVSNWFGVRGVTDKGSLMFSTVNGLLLTLKALGIFLPDSRYWLSIFFRFCTKSVLFYAAHCMSKSILGLKRTIPDHNRCHSHQKRRKPDQNR